MNNFIFNKLQEFADQNNLEVSIVQEREIDRLAILKFRHKETKKHTNIVINMYEQLNVAEKEIIKEVIEQVERRLLK